jgi:outer membrane protein OmpA-like peptidoglycan-associated protein
VQLKGIKMKSATQIDMPGAIDFDTGKSTIKMNANSKKVLEALVQVMKDNSSITTLSVEGNTDNEGEPKFDNKKLSQDRAQAVCDYLATKGIDKGRLQAMGYGSSNPLAPNDTAANKALNRRVEFHVLGFNGQPVQKDTSASSPPSPGAAPNVKANPPAAAH